MRMLANFLADAVAGLGYLVRGFLRIPDDDRQTFGDERLHGGGPHRPLGILVGDSIIDTTRSAGRK